MGLQILLDRLMLRHRALATNVMASLIMLALWPVVTAAEPQFNLFLRNFSSRQGIDVKVQQLSLEQLGQPNASLSEEKSGLIAAGPKTLEVMVFIPRNLPTAEAEEYGTLVRERVAKAFPHAKIEIRPSYFDAKELATEMQADNQAIDVELEKPGTPEETRAVGRFLQAFNRVKLELLSTSRIGDVRNAIRGLKSRSPHVRDVSIATVTGISKGVINATVWWGTSQQFMTGALSGATSYMLDVWFAKNAENWVRWKRQSRITWFENSRLVRWLNATETRRTYLVDFLNGFFWNLYFRTLAHLDNPSGPATAAFSAESIGNLWAPYALDLAVGGPISSSSQVAINQLRQKGYIPRSLQFYSFLAWDTNFTASSFLLQKGFVWMSIGLKAAEWTTRLGYIGANTALPARSKRIVLIDTRLDANDEAAILHGEGVEVPRDFDVAYADWQERVAGTQNQPVIAERFERFMRESVAPRVVSVSGRAKSICEALLGKKD